MIKSPNIPKRNNAYDGQKAHNDNRYYTIGRIAYSSWAAEFLPVADIVISERELVHINNSHYNELEGLGIDAIMYVTSIIEHFNEIRYDKNHDSYFFVVKIDPYTIDTNMNCAIIELVEEWIEAKRVYKIKTAHPESWGRLQKLELVCVNPRT